MEKSLLMLGVILAAASLAAWLDVRFPGLAPRSTWFVLANVGLSALVLNAAVPAAMAAILRRETLLAIEFSVVGVALPGFVYALISTLWFLKLCRTALTGRLP